MGGGYSSCTKAETIVKDVDLTGKVIFITGANTGIGRETARVLAGAHATIYLTCRDDTKGKETVDYIVTSTGNSDVHYLKMELGSLKSVRECAANFLALGKPLHILINNAGLVAPVLEKTEDGFESHMGINHLGPFLLTELLMPRLIESKPARVVNVASYAHTFAPINFDDLEYKTEAYSQWTAYGRSKAANILHAIGINQRYGSKGIKAISLHPGMIVTDIQRRGGVGMQVVMKLIYPFTKSIEQGAATSVFTAVHPSIDDAASPNSSAVYFTDCKPASASKHATDPAIVDQLWNFSVAATKSTASS